MKNTKNKSVIFFALILAFSLIFGTGAPYTVHAKECQHSWTEWEVDEKPTYFETGLKYRYCNKCYEEEYKTVPRKKMTKTEKKVVKRVKTYLKAAKKYDVKKMDSCFINKDTKYGFPTAKIDWVFKKYNKKIDWEFVNVTGTRRKYTVTVDVDIPDFYKQMHDAAYDGMFWGTDKWGLNDMNDHMDQITEKVIKKYNKKVKKCKKKTEKKRIKFTVLKKGNKWLIKSKSKKIVDIATAFYNEAMQDGIDEWEQDVQDYY